MKSMLKSVLGSMILGALIAACGVVYAMGSKPRVEQPQAEHPKATPPMEEKAAMAHTVYVCPDCHAVAMQAGKCKCGKELAPRHLLGVKDGQALLCECPAVCTCDAKGVKDGKCACGKEVAMASCKGLYCCPMGCPEVTDKPGKCACGMDMKKCE